MMRLAAAAWLVTLSSITAAQSNEGAQPVVDLSVKPLLCIIDHRTPVCEIDFLVSWRSDESGDFCLLNDFVEGPLLCWQAKDGGNYTDARAVSEGFTYWMTPEGSDLELAAISVEIWRMDSDDRRRRRRSRHVWDVL